MSSNGADDVMWEDFILSAAIKDFNDVVFVRNECRNSSDAVAQNDGSFTNICDKNLSNRVDT